MRFFSVLCSIAIFIFGCSALPSYSAYDARLNALKGKSINDAVADLGAPTRTVELAAGSKLYVWEEKSELRTAAHGNVTHDPGTNAERLTVTPSQRLPLDCTTEVEVDAKGKVVRVDSKGAACVSVANGGK